MCDVLPELMFIGVNPIAYFILESSVRLRKQMSTMSQCTMISKSLHFGACMVFQGSRFFFLCGVQETRYCRFPLRRSTEHHHSI